MGAGGLVGLLRWVGGEGIGDVRLVWGGGGFGRGSVVGWHCAGGHCEGGGMGLIDRVGSGMRCGLRGDKVCKVVLKLADFDGAPIERLVIGSETSFAQTSVTLGFYAWKLNFS